MTVLVCHCRVVYDAEIRAAIADGARDEFDVADVCGAGSECGGCVAVISDLLAEHGCTTGCAVAAGVRTATGR